MESESRVSPEEKQEVVFEHVCDACARKGLNLEAIHNCKNCCKLMCDACFQKHNLFIKGHEILDKEEVSRWKIAEAETHGVKCELHPEIEVEMYCVDHNCVCCYICMDDTHSTCENVCHVSVAAKGIHNNFEFKSLPFKASETMAKLRIVGLRLDKSRDQLQKTRFEIVSIFKDMRKQMNELFDLLEKNSSEVMEERFSNIKTKVRSDREICSVLYERIQTNLNTIKKSGKLNEISAFASYKTCLEFMASAELHLKSVPQDFKVSFSPDMLLLQNLFSRQYLGTFHITPNPTVSDGQPEEHIATAEHSLYSIQTEDDERIGYIMGICQIPDGQTVVIDNVNRKVKLLCPQSFSVVDAVTVYGIPQALCHTDEQNIAVTVADPDDVDIGDGVHFLCVENNKLAFVDSVQLTHECNGIAFYDDLIYIGSSNAIFVYNMDMEMQNKLLGDENVTDQVVHKFSFSSDGKYIHVINWVDDRFETFDRNGQCIRIFEDPNLQGITDVCVAEDDTIFACGWQSNTVLKISRNCSETCDIVADKLKNIHQPGSLYIDRQCQNLLVGLNDGNILVLSIK